MTASQSAFQRKKELAEFWATVSRNPDFTEVLVYARSAMVESGMTFEQMVGANRFLSILMGLCDATKEQTEMPSPGLVHDITGLISKVRSPKTTE